MYAKVKRFFAVLIFIIIAVGFATPAAAVKAIYIDQSTEPDFKKGKTDRVVITSEGEISLAYQTDTLLEPNDNNWTVNAITDDGQGTLYVATSGEGDIYRIRDLQNPEIIYGGGPDDAEHIFSLAMDRQGRLLAGSGGAKGLLIRFNSEGTAETLFEDDTIAYIWSIVVGPDGRIYLGTGPTGQVMVLDADGTHPKVLYTAKDKNILAVALDADGIVYAGGDKHGLVYRIDPSTGQTTIAYDTGHQEVTALVVDPKNRLYIATGDSRVRKSRGALILSDGAPGHPDSSQEDDADPSLVSPDNIDKENQDDAKPVNHGSQEDNSPQSAASPQPDDSKKPASEEQPSREIERPDMTTGRPSRANEVFQRVPQGYVTTLFSKPVVILAMAYQPAQNSLILGTGNDGQLLRINTETIEAAILHTGRPSVQVSAVHVDSAGIIYAGLANPSGLLAIHSDYTKQGEYLSEVIDAKQISRWGNLQFEADIPSGTQLMVSTRTGNTKDPEQGPWQQWSDPVSVQKDVQITSPPGRFLQYRLSFDSDGPQTPIVTRVMVAHTIPNLPPKMNSVTIKTNGKTKTKTQKHPLYVSGEIDIQWKAEDANKDSLIYQVYVQPVGHTGWIRIVEDAEKPNMKWDTRTAADGRYEVKVVASDSKDNPPDQALSDSRISRQFIVDNTPPEISDLSYSIENKRVTVRATVEDSHSPVGGADFCLDSDKDWISAGADDGVFDSQKESITYTVEIKTPGDHLLAVRFSDILNNTVYRNLMITVPE